MSERKSGFTQNYYGCVSGFSPVLVQFNMNMKSLGNIIYQISVKYLQYADDTQLYSCILSPLRYPVILNGENQVQTQVRQG